MTKRERDLALEELQLLRDFINSTDWRRTEFEMFKRARISNNEPEPAKIRLQKTIPGFVAAVLRKQPEPLRFDDPKRRHQMREDDLPDVKLIAEELGLTEVLNQINAIEQYKKR